MMMDLLVEFEKFPKEKEIIGELLMAYGEIEFAIVRLLNAFFESDDLSARILFRIKGEGPRLDIADAIMRHAFEPLGLKDKWIHAISAARHCKNIRNQFAHCHWWHDEKTRPNEVAFINLDQDSAAKEGILEVTVRPLSLPLLEKQREYFRYALSWLYYLDSQYREAIGGDLAAASIPDFEAPKSIPEPPLHIR